MDELEEDDDWEAPDRGPSPRNRFQKKSRVEVKRRRKGDLVYLRCRREGRQHKDRAIRETQERKLLKDLGGLQQRVAAGRLKQEDKIQRVIGRLLERYPRFARYYRIAYDAQRHALSWQRQANKKAIAGKLDGSYILKTERQDPTADEIWRTYIVLTSRSVCVHNRKVMDRSDDLNRAGSSERRDKVLAATEDFPFVATDNCTLSGFWRA